MKIVRGKSGELVTDTLARAFAEFFTYEKGPIDEPVLMQHNNIKILFMKDKEGRMEEVKP